MAQEKARCGYIIYSLCNFVCLFLLLLISSPRIRLAASNFSRRFIVVQGGEFQIFVNFAPPEAQNLTNWPARGPRLQECKHYRIQMRRRKRHARDAPFVKSRGVWT